jgi:hypothetical protein
VVAAHPFVRNRTGSTALPRQNSRGFLLMPSAAYFRRQADICLRLSLVSSDDATSTRLVAMAKEYLAAGEAVEQQAASDSPFDQGQVHHHDVHDFARNGERSGKNKGRNSHLSGRTIERHRFGSNR